MESHINKNDNTKIKLKNIIKRTNDNKKEDVNDNSKISKVVKQDKLLRFNIGTYEGRVFCLDINLINKDLNFDNSFSFRVTDNSIKTIVNKDNFIFVSGNDEILHIFDTKNKEEKGMVMTYNGAITNIIFTKKFLITSGDDTNIHIFLLENFSHVHSLLGHKASLSNLLIHKSKKFLLSSAKDSSLIIWNLLTGLKIVKYNFKDNLVCKKMVFVNSKQERAVLQFENQLWVFDIFKDTEKLNEYIVKKQTFPEKILDIFTFKTYLLIIFLSGNIRLYEDFDKIELIKEEEAEERKKDNLKDDLIIKFKEFKIEKPDIAKKGN